MRAWLTRHDLLPVDAEIGEDELRSMLAVRDALRTVIDSHSGNAISGEAAYESFTRGVVESEIAVR